MSAHEGIDAEDNDFRPLEAELDEHHPKATRTLFVGNLEKEVTTSELKAHFDQFGEIIVCYALVFIFSVLMVRQFLPLLLISTNFCKRSVFLFFSHSFPLEGRLSARIQLIKSFLSSHIFAVYLDFAKFRFLFTISH